jgi:hypothetical protein
MLEQAMNMSQSNELDRNEQISMFQSLLEVVIRHALKSKKKEEMALAETTKQLMMKPASTTDIRSIQQ